MCRAQVLLAAAQSHLLSEKKFAVVLIPRLCNTILAAPSSARHVSHLCLTCYSSFLYDHEALQHAGCGLACQSWSTQWQQGFVVEYLVLLFFTSVKNTFKKQ